MSDFYTPGQKITKKTLWKHIKRFWVLTGRIFPSLYNTHIRLFIFFCTRQVGFEYLRVNLWENVFPRWAVWISRFIETNFTFRLNGKFCTSFWE